MSKMLLFPLTVILLLVPTSMSVSSNVGGSQSELTDDQLVVHEWGTFTSVGGRDGEAVEWRPLDGSSDLPSFVYAAEGLAEGTGLRNKLTCLKCSLAALVRMETPVLYFYSSQDTTVSVRVRFPQGKITEWYPQARSVGDTAIDWGYVRVEPAAQVEYPVEPNPSHYYPARQTDSASLRVCGDRSIEYEKFLFYRGVGFFPVPVQARLSRNKIVIRTTDNAPVADIVVYENQDGRAGYSISRNGVGSRVVSRPQLESTVQAASDEVGQELRGILVSQGLFEREADAMLETWRDSWFEEGLRIFFVVPRPVTDQILPLTIEPKPSRIERVLVGRVEVVTPEMERAAIRTVRSEGTNKAAQTLKAKYDRLLGPILRRAVDSTGDYGIKARLRQILTR
jgi:hypothetical protein